MEEGEEYKAIELRSGKELLELDKNYKSEVLEQNTSQCMEKENEDG